MFFNYHTTSLFCVKKHPITLLSNHVQTPLFFFSSDHWRKNIPVLALKNRVYAIDLIGYGYSDKPNPRELGESFYTFETWGEQLNTFCAEVIKSEAFFICNSIGGMLSSMLTYIIHEMQWIICCMCN